ncbi:FadR/GntR family transcriptional regulator [Patulibacter defluvii]|uniref:FadR/GntR family transcriptional regulator n=1 Tax=Patulibacter defluvii TaxID=3095358 RepID=UPI002A74DFE9|nr:FadR/GntR family transcriptional regulator [Patulibacter sp. DM4]
MDEQPGPPDWSRLAEGTLPVGDRLAGAIERMIRDGQVAVGSRLPPERELAQQMGVSRASLRQALHELELRGLLDRAPGRGTTVVDPDRGELSEPLLRRMNEVQRTITEVMDLRAAIEPPVAARAAMRATDADIAALHEIVAAMEATDQLDEVSALDVRFHVAIGRATHNPLLARLMETTSEWATISRSRGFLTAERRAASVRAHRVIANAIEAHDPTLAMSEMARHVTQVGTVIAADLDGEAEAAAG